MPLFFNRYDPQEKETRQIAQKKYNSKKEFSSHDTHTSLQKKKFDLSVLTDKTASSPLQRESNNVLLDVKILQPYKEVVSAASPKIVGALPQMGSSPDVIIEEIIEENVESE